MDAMAVVWALAVFVVFGTVSLLMFRSAASDWRSGRASRDRVSMFSGFEQVWPALLAGLIAVAGPIAIVVSG